MTAVPAVGASSGAEPSLAHTIGFDRTAAQLDGWLDGVWNRDRARIRASLESLREVDPTLFPVGLDAANVSDAGLRYLCFRTHFQRYTYSTEQIRQNRQDLAATIAMAMAVSGNCTQLPASVLTARRRILIDGSNLLLEPRQMPDAGTIILDGASDSVSVRQVETAASFDADRIRVSQLSTEAARALPFEDDFVFFFSEEATTDRRGSRRVLIEERHLSTVSCILEGARSYLRTTFPGVWSCVRQHVVCLSFTSLVDTESSTDTRDPRGAIVVNPRSQWLEDLQERIAWMAQGLYHEAKHIQFFDTYRARVPPHVGMDDSRAIHLSASEPRIPCAWKGTPSLRSMSDHLLSLQAFIPGAIVALRGLGLSPYSRLSPWIRQHIEMDMRAINGAIASLMLGGRFLTEEGRRLASAIRHDYVEILLPTYQTLAS